MAECMKIEDAMNMDNEQAKLILIPLMKMMLDQNGCPISSAYFALGKAVESLSNDAVPLDDYRSMEETVNKLTKALERAVPVVRCKDCKHYGRLATKEERETSADLVCDYWDSDGLAWYDFCSYGERRSADEES